MDLQIPVREQAWLKVSKVLFDLVPAEAKENLLKKLPEAWRNQTTPDELALTFILKFVELEAFRTERKAKELSDISDEEIFSYFKGSILWGSLFEALTSKDSWEDETIFKAVAYFLEFVQDCYSAGLAPGTFGVYVSQEFFIELLDDFLKDPKISAKNVIERAKEKGAYEDMIITIEGVTIKINLELRGTTMEAVKFEDIDE